MALTARAALVAGTPGLTRIALAASIVASVDVDALLVGPVAIDDVDTALLRELIRGGRTLAATWERLGPTGRNRLLSHRYHSRVKTAFGLLEIEA